MSQHVASDLVFQHSAAFQAGEVSGNLQLDAYEEIYQKLFVEVLEDGIITAEERQRLEKAAASLGLDKARLEQLERALTVDYECLHGRSVVRADAGAPLPATAVPATEGQPPLSMDPGRAVAEALTLRKRIAELEAHIQALETELENARAQRDVEVDLSLLDAAPAQVEVEDPAALQRRIRHDPRDVGTLHTLYRAYAERGDVDGQWRTAQALSYLGAAAEAERALYERRKEDGLIRPTHSLSSTTWQRHLFHADDEVLTGQIFATIASAVLLGRVAALRRTRSLIVLDPRQYQPPETSTLQAVRCFAWAASILGMASPPLYADSGYDGLVQMVPGVPPASRIGMVALSGRSSGELAFVAGRHLAGFREERFLRQLFPDVLELQDLFVAGLIIANPALPIDAESKARVTPVSRAVEALLQPPQVHRLRALFARFVEEGGRTNLQRWARGTDLTALRAGFLLCDDLHFVDAILRMEGDSARDAKMNDLLEFCTSERYGQLRAELGISLGAQG